jgi:hypothetical protein
MIRFSDMKENDLYYISKDATLLFCREDDRLFSVSKLNCAVNEVELVRNDTTFQPYDKTFRAFLELFFNR